jgi:hypothetical protein
MQKWEYCILDYETQATKSKQSSELILSFTKGKVHYLTKGGKKTENYFKFHTQLILRIGMPLECLAKKAGS